MDYFHFDTFSGKTEDTGIECADVMKQFNMQKRSPAS
jgi:hypothetical protein